MPIDDRTVQVFENTKATQELPADLVSVCVSLYNYAEFLPECLDSIARQTHKQIDLVVVDDASQNDNSLLIAKDWLESHAALFHRVLLLSHVQNQGAPKARNTAVNYALSEYIFVIDADNEIYPRAISRLYETLSSSNFGAAYTQLEFFGEITQLGAADIWSKERFSIRNYVDTMALIKKSAWQLVGGYTHRQYGWQDYDFWCKFIEHGIEGIYIPEILCRYRVHNNSMTHLKCINNFEEIIKDMKSRHPWLQLT